jgi:hypothetical protein
LQGPLQNLLKKAIDFLPKFNGEGNRTTFEHIRKHACTLCLLNIVHEDVVCRVFPFTFEGKGWDW